MQKFSAMNAHGFRVAARCLPDRSHYSRGSLGRSPGLIRGSGEGDVPLRPGAHMLATGDARSALAVLVGSVPGTVSVWDSWPPCPKRVHAVVWLLRAGSADGISRMVLFDGVGVRCGIAEWIGGPDGVRRAYDSAAAFRVGRVAMRRELAAQDCHRLVPAYLSLDIRKAARRAGS